jgi:hypothetical protein
LELWGKKYGIKSGAIGNMFENRIKNFMRTHWEQQISKIPNFPQNKTKLPKPLGWVHATTTPHWVQEMFLPTYALIVIFSLD